MAANSSKLKACYRAVISFLKNVLTMRYPLWLFIVVCLAFVLWYSLIACSRDASLQRVVVGNCKWNGHSFVMFRDQDSGASLAVIHDPDCDCQFTEILMPY